MKHLLSGTAMAAALVIAAPVWAQTAAPMAPSTAKPMQHHVMHHHGHHHVVHHRGGTSPSDNVANQLNAQQAAGMAPAPAYGRPTGPYGQPNQIYGIPGAGQASPSPEFPSGSGPAYVPGQYQASPSPNAPAAR
jgi:hypothetical protein